MKDRFFLRTERLGFRWWIEGDADLAHTLWGDPKVTELLFADPALSREQTDAMLEEQQQMEAESSIQYWPLFLLKEETFIGCCGLRPHDRKGNIPELGFHICADHWGHGYAQEASRAVVKYAFLNLGFHMLFAGHHQDNHASEHILLKLGFAKTGEEVYPPTGLVEPVYHLTKKTFLSGLDA